MTEKKTKKENELDVCTDIPGFAEHARPNEPAQEPCDDGRAGIVNQETNKKPPETDKKKKKRDL